MRNGHVDFEMRTKKADNSNFIVANDKTMKFLEYLITHLLSQSKTLEFQHHPVFKKYDTN